MLELDSTNESFNSSDNTNDAPEHLKGLQVLAEGYQYYMDYLKNGGDSGVSTLLGELSIDGI